MNATQPIGRLRDRGHVEWASSRLAAGRAQRMIATAMSQIRSTSGLFQWGIMSALLCLATATATAAAAAEPSPSPTTQPVTVDVDISGLPASEQAALVPIIRAARQMDALYMRQVWPDTRALISARQGTQTPAAEAELAALNFFKGPWGPSGAAFIAGVPTEQPIGDYYPSGATKHDMESWLATLSESDRKRALDAFTVIERGQSDRFEVVSYARHYKDGLNEAAAALREAAALTREPTLRNYLTLRAQALLDDDYYASDVAFVGLKGPIDVVLGPYEVDDDNWFGAKTAYEAAIALVNEPATRRFAKIATHLQELEDHLPLAASMRGRTLGALAPVVVLDAIYHGGLDGAGGAAAGYGLPNDLRVLDAVGARTGTYSNILKLRYDSKFRPIAEALLAPGDLSRFRFEDIRDAVLFIRMFDSVGPQFVTGTKRPIVEALRESGSVAAQIRSMLLSLWGHRYLIEHGYLDQHEAASVYSGFLIEALARYGPASVQSQASTYVLNHLLESGGISVGPDGRIKINSAAADADVVRAATEFISAMSKGDAIAVKSLLQHYVVVTPAIRGALARLGPTPALQRPIYRTADRLSPVSR